MQFDPRRRVYVNDDGSVVSPAELRQMIEDYIAREKQEVDTQAQKLIAGSISSAVFFEWLREKIKEVHGAAGLVAYGGEDQMNPERWARIGHKIATETAYANAFEKDFQASEQAAQAIVDEAVSGLASAGISVSRRAVEDLVWSTPGSEIPSAAESLTDSAIAKEVFERAATSDRISQLIFGETPSRSQMYMESIYGTHENSVSNREADAGVVSGRRVCEEDRSSCDECVAAASEDYMPLDEISDIGSLTCMSNCRCTIEFDYMGIQPLTIDRSVYAPGFANVNSNSVF